MNPKNSVFIGASLDGYIADKNGGLGFLDSIPEINNIDTGYFEFTANIDALVMGRVTFETVLGFGIEWPYKKPVFVLSNTMKEVPAEYEGKVFLVSGPLKEVVNEINNKGYSRLYIDGGKTIQSFLKEDMIDDMIITTIPILIGGGSSLFGDLNKPLEFECTKSIVFINKIVQNHFRRIRK